MSYIETAARYAKVMEDGKTKKVTERFLVDALSCVEAETRTIEELTRYVSGDLEVTANKKVNISEFVGDKGADKFYLAKVAFITFDEKSGKEKKTVSQMLVGAQNFTEAYLAFGEAMKGTMADFDLVSLAETPIKEFYPAKL